MRAYKYVDLKFADSVGTGQLKIGTLHNYSTLGGLRRDIAEATLTRTLNHQITDTNSDPKGVEAARLCGIKLDNCTNVTIKNATAVTRHPDAFCLCMSRSSDNWWLKRERPQAVFEILDIKSIANEIRRQCSFTTYACKEVKYLPRIVDALVDRASVPDPFVKDLRFEPENEVRIVWPSDARTMQSFILEPSIEISSLLKRIY